MDPNQIAVAVTGFASSLVGAGIAFWAQASHWNRSRKAQAVDEELEYVHQLLVKTNLVDLRAHQLAVAARSRGSLDGTVFALLGSADLIDVNATVQALYRDAEDLTSAAVRLWLVSDAKTVDLARAVSDAAGAVMDAHSTRRRRGLVGWFLNVLRGPRLGDAVRIEAARVALAEKREDLVSYVRARFGRVPELSRTSGAAT